MIKQSIIVLIIITVFFSAVSKTDADIYKYVDERGVTHLTNVPASTKYKLLRKANKARYSERKYDNIINKLCKKYGVETSFIKAMVKTESNFDPYAVSKKGATGLMQLMPEKAKDLSVKDSFDPKQNLDGGIRHVSYLIKKYEGDVRLALAAYNAGENAVKRNNGIPPFVETQNYIIKVLRLVEKYR
jgi:soluble lytic murein transglycosylase-like protein